MSALLILMTDLVSLEILLLDLLSHEPQLKNHMQSVIIVFYKCIFYNIISLPDCLEMRYVFSITFFMINGIIQAQKLVSQVYYLDQCQKYNNIKKEAPTTSTILS